MNGLQMIITLAALAVTTVTSKRSRIIDLTHDLSTTFPLHPTFPKMNFTILHRKQHEKFWVEFNWFGLVEHAGTHMDAPSHFSRGNLRMHEVPIERFIGPGVVIKVADKVARNLQYELSVEDILRWEEHHGRVPQGAVVMMDAGWSARVPDPYRMFGTDDPTNVSTFRTPSVSPEAAEFLVQKRDNVSIVGVETISADQGWRSDDFPTHVTLQAAGILILENVANLDQVPEAGAIIYCMPLKLYEGSGSPIRAFAIIDEAGFDGSLALQSHLLYPYILALTILVLSN